MIHLYVYDGCLTHPASVCFSRKTGCYIHERIHFKGELLSFVIDKVIANFWNINKSPKISSMGQETSKLVPVSLDEKYKGHSLLTLEFSVIRNTKLNEETIK